MTEKWEHRERKLRKRRALDMVVTNRSIKTLILQEIGKKAKRERNRPASTTDATPPR